jgi:DNA-binding response OmpR family regulator
MAKILLVEDDVDYSGVLEGWLTDEHYTVEVLNDGSEARDRLAAYQYDLVILDWMLPGVTGVELCKEMRSEGNTTPVLMLTGRSAIEDKEQGFDAGADDYLTKPFNFKELSMRVRALLRRASGLASNCLTVGDIVLDPVSYSVTKGGEEVRLQRNEFALLEFLMRNPNRVFSAEALLERVWTADSEATSDAIRTCMKRLRKKLDSDPDSSIIQTLHGVGYKLQKS